ncbi:hypothetical protein LCGC14_1587030 [marine sediment metagenome]|uniref:Reverse transcriptase domain-containing protein n=1 Tax=marine sediment metagenome TaxID=412755 RepID=A0A0F9KVS7_9ZZZZ
MERFDLETKTLEKAFNAVFHNNYKFTDFVSFNVDEEIKVFEVDGRKVFKTSDKYKAYLRFIDRVIFRHLAKNEKVSHAFVKGKSPLTAVQAHTASKYFFLTDIKEFYSNITCVDVLEVLSRDKQLIPISDFDEYIELIAKLTTIDGSLPVGLATSPKMSNAFLYEFDGVLDSYCTKNALSYTRYADDIIISGEQFSQLSSCKKTVQHYLNDYASDRMLINENKTLITQVGNKVKILGLIILPNGKITIDGKYKKKLELLLHFYTTDKNKFEDYLAQELKGKERSLFGLLHYAKSIDPNYLEKLQKKYGAYSLRYLMEDKWNDPR